MTKNIEAFAEMTKEEKLIFDGKILRLYHDTVTLPDNNTAMREYCRHNGGVGVIPVTDNGDILCVEQYRYPHAKMTLEIPAGKLEAKDCDHRDSALRELREETGAVCDKLTYLGQLRQGVQGSFRASRRSSRLLQRVLPEQKQLIFVSIKRKTRKPPPGWAVVFVWGKFSVCFVLYGEISESGSL